MNLTVTVPAFNESAYLPATLDALETAAEHLRAHSGAEVDIVVVDNNSTDGTAAVARSKGASVVHEPVQGIARARNAGAHHAHGDVLVFVDADTLVPPTLLEAIRDTMSDPACVGGGVDVESQPRRRFTRLYLRGWRVLARCREMVQGSDSVLPEDVLEQVGGYDEQAWIGEDVDFYRAFSDAPGQAAARCGSIEQPRGQASSRRFDKWPLWKTPLWTNPLFIALFRRRRAFWAGWYRRSVR